MPLIRPAKNFDLLVLVLSYLEPNQGQNTSPWAWHCWTPGLVIAFIQGIRAPTFDSKFQEASKNFAKSFLFKEKLYEDLLAKISFFSEHPGINEQILEYAVVAAILHRDDVSTHLPNPLEVASFLAFTCSHEVFSHLFRLDLKSSRCRIIQRQQIVQITICTCNVSSFWKFVQLCFLDNLETTMLMERLWGSFTSQHTFTNTRYFSNNPEDIKWDHYREDTLFHVFHVLVHQIFQGHAAEVPPPPRIFELFFYTHQQITRR